MNHSTEFLNAPSLAALTVGLFYQVYRIELGGLMKIHDNALDLREQQTRGGHRESKRGDIPEQNLRISHPPCWPMTVGTARQTRSY